MTSQTQQYFWKSQLKERGWTDGAITRFLGEPDCTRPNPHSKRQPPMLLWSTSRVIEVEQTEAFQQWHNSTKDRRKAASDRMLAKMEVERQKTIKQFSDRLTNSVRQALKEYSSGEQLEEDAIDHWAAHRQNWLWNRDRYDEVVTRPSRTSLDAGTLRRWVENFVRHELTNYENLLAQSKGAIGRDQAYDAMKAIVATEVTAFYSQLKTTTGDRHDQLRDCSSRPIQIQRS